MEYIKCWVCSPLKWKILPKEDKIVKIEKANEQKSNVNENEEKLKKEIE